MSLALNNWAQDFMERGKVLTTKLLSQGYKKKTKQKKKKQTGSNT